MDWDGYWWSIIKSEMDRLYGEILPLVQMSRDVMEGKEPAHVLAAKHQIIKREMPGRMLHFLSIKYIHLTEIRTD
jgi:hypothetical protein